MSRLIALLPIAALMTFATTAQAQTCGGTASFTAGAVRLGAGMDFADDGNQVGASVALGRAAGPFVSGSVGRLEFEDLDESGTAFGIELGYSLPVAGRASLEICPVLSFVHAGADISANGNSVDLSSRALAAGVAIGGVASSTPTFAFVPSATFAWVNQKLELSGFMEGETTDDYGAITLAAGLVFNRNVTVRPNMSFSVGSDDSEATFGIAFAMNFGNQSAAR
jgi:hypothetical protein